MSNKLFYLVSFILVLSLALACGAQAADPDLVGWWPLNEGSGDVATDLSGGGNDGAIQNADTGGLGDGGSVWVNDPDRGTVISFNGTAASAFVRAGSIPQMTLTNDFTWSFWAKHSDENTADNDIILGNRMDENAVDFVPRQFIKFTPTKFEWHMNGNGDDNLEYEDIPADVWLHHAVVKAGDQLTYYRNGIEASSGTFTQPLDFPQPLFFGGDNEGAEGENWSGLMSDVRMYNRALTGLEVLAVVKGVEQIDMGIGYAIQAPVLDGEYDGIWAAASTQSFVPLDDPADGSGTWKVLYDKENLYVLVDMTDDSLQNDSANSWQDDSVEIYFDGGNTKLDTPLSGDDHQYTFGWTTDDIQGNNVSGYTEGIEHAQVDTDTGWRIEVKMPWTSIWGVVPQAGDLIGIDCYYNDDDDGGDSREGKMLSFSAVEGWNDASQWATAVLATVPEPVDPGTDGLVAFYALDGDTNDSSGNGIDGVIHNAETGGLGDGGSVWVEDPERGTVISFNGTADGAHVRAGEIPQMTLTNDFTWAFWANQKAENTADNDIIFGNRMDENAVDFVPRQFIKFTPTKFEWHMNGNGDDNMEYEDIPADVWLHHAVVKTADQLTYYRNGIVAGSGMITQPLDVPQPLFFGGDNEGSEGENWNGLMSDACIYDRALSAGEVMFLAGFRPGLVAHYKLDDGEGTIVVDSSGNGNDGIITTNPDFVDPTWINGILGGALEFYGDTSVYGSANHVECAHSNSLDVTGPISIALWIRPDADDPEGQGLETAPMAKAHSAASPSWSWQVRYGWGSSQPYMAFTFNTSPRAWAYVDRNLERGVWAHITCSHDGETLKCYLNGEETDSTPMGAITSSPAPVLIGSDGWGCDWIGAIDDVRIYDRALSEAEIIGLAGN
jgi:hypothetical protein